MRSNRPGSSRPTSNTNYGGGLNLSNAYKPSTGRSTGTFLTRLTDIRDKTIVCSTIDFDVDPVWRPRRESGSRSTRRKATGGAVKKSLMTILGDHIFDPFQIHRLQGHGVRLWEGQAGREEGCSCGAKARQPSFAEERNWWQRSKSASGSGLGRLLGCRYHTARCARSATQVISTSSLLA